MGAAPWKIHTVLRNDPNILAAATQTFQAGAWSAAAEELELEDEENKANMARALGFCGVGLYNPLTGRDSTHENHLKN